jgi:hypothetical protein
MPLSLELLKLCLLYEHCPATYASAVDHLLEKVENDWLQLAQFLGDRSLRRETASTQLEICPWNTLPWVVQLDKYGGGTRQGSTLLLKHPVHKTHGRFYVDLWIRKVREDLDPSSVHAYLAQSDFYAHYPSLPRHIADVFDSPTNEWDQRVLKWVRHWNASARFQKGTPRKQGNKWIYNFEQAPFCLLAERVHTSNNTRAILYPEKGILIAACFNQRCQARFKEAPRFYCSHPPENPGHSPSLTIQPDRVVPLSQKQYLSRRIQTDWKKSKYRK